MAARAPGRGSDGAGHIRILDDSGAAVAHVESTTDELAVEWMSQPDKTLGGDAHARDGGAGASILTVTVRARHEVGRDWVRQLMDKAADQLAREVSDNFTAG